MQEKPKLLFYDHNLLAGDKIQTIVDIDFLSADKDMDPNIHNLNNYDGLITHYPSPGAVKYFFEDYKKLEFEWTNNRNPPESHNKKTAPIIFFRDVISSLVEKVSFHYKCYGYSTDNIHVANNLNELEDLIEKLFSKKE